MSDFDWKSELAETWKLDGMWSANADGRLSRVGLGHEHSTCNDELKTGLIVILLQHVKFISNQDLVQDLKKWITIVHTTYNNRSHTKGYRCAGHFSWFPRHQNDKVETNSFFPLEDKEIQTDFNQASISWRKQEHRLYLIGTSYVTTLVWL